MRVISIVISILAIVIVLSLIIDFSFSTKHKCIVHVIDKHYEPSHHSTGYDSRGRFVSTNENEKYIIICKVDGKIHSQTCESETYYSKEIGKTYNAIKVLGCLGIFYSIRFEDETSY